MLKEKKLTEVTIRLPESMKKAMTAFAAADGLDGIAELTRNLYTIEIQKRYREFKSAQSIFGDDADLCNVLHGTASHSDESGAL